MTQLEFYLAILLEAGMGDVYSVTFGVSAV